MIRVMIPLCVALLCPVVLAQSPNAVPDRSAQVNQSSAILVGAVDGVLWVVDPQKRVNRTRTQRNGQIIVELQNPAEYVVGRVIRLRVNEIIKGNRRVRAGGIINIFLPGALTAEGTPALAEKREYLVFLSPLKDKANNFAGTMLYRPGTHTNSEVTFMPKSSYVIVGDDSGAIQISPENLGVINEIRAAVRNTRK